MAGQPAWPEQLQQGHKLLLYYYSVRITHLAPDAVALQVKDCVGEQVQQLVPSLVNSGIAAHVPPMIEEVRRTAATVARFLAVHLVTVQELLRNNQRQQTTTVTCPSSWLIHIASI